MVTAELVIGSVFAALVISGATLITQSGHLGYRRFRQKLEDRVSGGLTSEWIAKPLLLCDECMSSVWGTVIYWLLPMNIEWYWKLAIWPFFLLSLPPIIRRITISLKKNGIPDPNTDKHS